MNENNLNVPTPKGPLPRTPAPPPELPPPPKPIEGPVGLRVLVEALLKNPLSISAEASGGRRIRIALLLAITGAVCIALYGVLVGMFSGGDSLWIAPAKITLGALFSGLLCFPSLYIFSCLSGADAEAGQTFCVLSAMLALMGILLIGFAPVAWIFSMSTEAIGFMGALHITFWVISAWFGFGFINKAFGKPGEPISGHLFIWCTIFLLVTLQMTCTLRPLLGEQDTLLPTEKKFFLAHWSDNLWGDID